MKKYRTYLILYAAFLAVWVIMTRGAVSPLIYPDEAGYLGWGRTLAGTPSEVWRYLPGYGFLLAPVFLVTDQLTKAYGAIIFLNCLMGAALPVLFYSILGRMKLLEGKERLLAAVAAGLYPAWMMYGNLALCEVFLTFLYTVLLWSVASWGKGKRYWAVTAVCCVWLAVSHGRGMAAVAGTLAAFCAYAWERPWKKRAATVCGAILMVGIVCGVVFLAGTESVNGVHLREQVLGLFSIKGLWNSFSTLLSQGYYLVLSTFGIAALGIWQGVRLLRRKNSPAAWFVLVTFLLAAALSAVFMSHHEKPDHILYGRYNEFALGGVLLLGFLAFFKQRRWLWVPGIFLLLAVFTYVRYGQSLSGIDSNLCHTWGLYFYKILFSRFTFWGVAVWFGLWGGMAFLIRRYNPKSAAMFLCGLFLATACYTKYDYFYKGAAPRYQPSQLEGLLEETVSAQPLQEDTMGYPWGVYHLLTQNPQLRLEEGSELLLTPMRRENGSLVGSESYDTLYLYAVGEAEEQFRQKDMIVGQSPSGSVVLERWGEQSVSVTVENTGSPWLCYHATEHLKDCVRLVVWIEGEKGEVEQKRLDLPRNLYAGDKATIEIPFSLADGQYRVQVSTAVDLSSVIASLCLEVTVQGGKITWCESAEPVEKKFLLFHPQDYPRQTEGMFRGYSTGKTVFDRLSWNTAQKYLTLYIRGTEKQVQVQVNGQELPLVKRGGNAMVFSLEGITVIDQIQVESRTVVPAKTAGLPECLRWLRADSSCKPVALFVRGMDKLFGVRWDFCPYGIWIDRITVGDEL